MLEAAGTTPEVAAVPNHVRRQEADHRMARAGIWAAVALGCLIRAIHVLRGGFPLNDGGLFYQMVRDLQHARYALPAFTSYNDAGIPFSYPPFTFYLAGLLNDLTGIDLFTLFRVLPLIATCLTLVAFALLARAIVGALTTVAIAVFAFALIPRSFIWLLMGGGLTRSFGFLFAILAMYSAHLLYTRRQWRYVAPATLFAALTVLSHLETGWFLAFTLAIFFLAHGRHRHGLRSSIVVVAGTVALTAPWWATVLTQHGVSPFLAANSTGGSVFSSGEVRMHVLLSLLRFTATSESFFPLIGALALLGALASVIRGRWVLPVWWVVTILLEARAFPTFTTLPVAMLAGVGVTGVLLPLMVRVRDAAYTSDRDGTRERPARWRTTPVSRQWVAATVLGCFLVYATASALMTKSGMSGEVSSLVSLSPDERAAMRWVDEQTPSGSRFLLITGDNWATDKTSEWFPVLAARVSVATVQGFEWLPDHAFDRKLEAYDRAHECGYRTAACLTEWSTESETGFTHVYVPKQPGGQCCYTLVTSLKADAGYELLHDGPGATIFARRGAEPQLASTVRDSGS